MKIIITESQYNLIKEATGVPENILNEARVLYNIVKDKLKEINSTDKEEYLFNYNNNIDWFQNYQKYDNSIEQYYKILDCYNLFIRDYNSDINIKNCDFVFRMRLDTLFEKDLCDILDVFKENPNLN